MRIVRVGWLAVVAMGCGYTKVYVPTSPSAAGLAVPVQQKLMSTAVNQAVGRSSEGLGLSKFAGRTAQVEVNGVFPPSERAMLDYVATLVEAELERSGVIVIPRPLVPAGSVLMVPAKSDEKKPDLRVVASLDWGGIDYTTRRRVHGGKLAGTIVLGIFTAGIGAAIVAAISPPYFHELTLDSRIKLTVRVFPQVPGLLPANAAGEGAAQLIIDPLSSDGHMATFVADAPE